MKIITQKQETAPKHPLFALDIGEPFCLATPKNKSRYLYIRVERNGLFSKRAGYEPVVNLGSGKLFHFIRDKEVWPIDAEVQIL